MRSRPAAVNTARATDSFAVMTEGLTAWWREAGVSHIFLDEPRAWLAETTDTAAVAYEPPSRATEYVVPASPAASAPEPIGGARESWPTTLAEFRDWWLTEPSLAE